MEKKSAVGSQRAATRIVGGVVAVILSSAGTRSVSAEETWTFLDNGKIRLGVNRSAGAAIGWFSESGRDRNLLNRFDLGRYLQQSWYGAEDGSDWNGKPWRWNPVQAGSWKNRPARVTAFEAAAARIASTSVPVHWASGKTLEEVEFRQEVTLLDHVARIDFEMIYHGDREHPLRDQELPAVFVNATLTRLHLHVAGTDAPETIEPGWPNERHELARDWVAWTDGAGRGLGIRTPGVHTLTCYRVTGDSNNRGKGACSYVAPIARFAIGPGFRHRYTVFVTHGTLEEIEHRLARASVEPPEEKRP